MGFLRTAAGQCLMVAWVLAGASLAYATPGDYFILRSFPAPVMSPDGIFWDGTHIWTTECTSEDIYKLDPTDGTVVAKHTIPGILIDHFTWDGSSLWVNDHHDGSLIRKIDLDALEVVENFAIPWDNVMGVAWDGVHLWTTDPSTNQLFQLDPTTGEITDVLDFDFPGYALSEQTCGIGWDGVCLWVGDIVSRKYHQVDPATGEVVLTITAPGGEESLPTGFAWDGSYMWVVDENPSNPTIFQLDVELLKSGPCAHGARERENCDEASARSCIDGLTCARGDSEDGPDICRPTCDLRALTPCNDGYSCWQVTDNTGACLPDPPVGPADDIDDVITVAEVQVDSDTSSVSSETGGTSGGCTVSRSSSSGGHPYGPASWLLIFAVALLALLGKSGPVGPATLRRPRRRG